MNALAGTLLDRLNAAEAYSAVARQTLSHTAPERAKVVMLRAALLEAASTLAANIDVDGEDLEAALAEAVSMLRHATRRMCAGLEAHRGQLEGVTLQ